MKQTSRAIILASVLLVAACAVACRNAPDGFTGETAATVSVSATLNSTSKSTTAATQPATTARPATSAPSTAKSNPDVKVTERADKTTTAPHTTYKMSNSVYASGSFVQRDPEDATTRSTVTQTPTTARPTTTKPTTTRPNDPYDVYDYRDPEDFYYDHYDDFFDYYDAENYFYDHP